MATVSFPSRCAVAVICGEHLVSQVYPASVPVEVFIDSAVELLTEDLKRRGVDAFDSDIGYELHRANGTRLDIAKTLDELGVEDGSTLMLVPTQQGDSFEPHYESLSTGLARIGKTLFPPVTAETAARTAMALLGMTALAILGLAVYTRTRTDALAASIATGTTGLLLASGAFSIWRWWPDRPELLAGFAWPAVPLLGVGCAAAAPGALGSAHIVIAALTGMKYSSTASTICPPAMPKMPDRNSPENVAAVIVEPIAGSAGWYIPPKGYLKRLREICDKHGILLIFDEVITGFGRLGTPFAADFYGVQPDMLNFAKAVTNGVFPLGGVVCSDRIYNAMMGAHGSAPEHAIEFFHGYTYSGHPVACAAAIATLELFQEENLFARAGEMGKVLGDAMHSALKGLPNVISIRSLGCAAVVELSPIAGLPGKRAFDVFMDCFHRGVLVRNAGENLVFAPPYIVEKSHIDTMVNVLADAIKRNA